MSNWSIRAIQDLVLNERKWEKKNMYATDAEKCLAGVYYSLIGEDPTNPTTPRQKRKMEVGEMIEQVQVKKLKALGIFVGGQDRIADEEYMVSGRPDALVISPDNCTETVKIHILAKKEIFQSLQDLDKLYWEAAGKKDFSERNLIQKKKDYLYEEDEKISKMILDEAEKDPTNQIMLLEIKSIVTTGFEWRIKEGKPMDSHSKQVMFYGWKLRNKFKNLIMRVVYVDNAYQDLIEFDVEYDERIIDDLKKKWQAIKEAVRNKVPAPCCPDVVRNPMNGRYQINFQADWCNYHIKCTGDPNWKAKAIKKVEELNSNLPKRTYAARRKSVGKDDNTNEPKLPGHKA